MNLNKTSLAVIAICTFISGCGSSDSLPANDSDTPNTSQPLEDPENNGVENTDPLTPESTMLTPTVEAGSDTDRLLKGINRQIARTILDLNARLRDGISLTEQQNTCLGNYDPAAGQQLLTINCERSLATGDVLILVQQAGYYDTPECHSAIFNGEISDCFLQTARLSVPPEWASQELPIDGSNDGPNGAQLIAASIEVFYAINSTYLRIENNERQPLTGLFQCDINLLNNDTSASVGSQSCASIINLAANRFDALLPE